MSKFISVIAIAALVTTTGAVLAQGGSSQGTQQQNRVQDPTTHEDGTGGTGNQYQNAIQNQGETPQIRAKEQEGLLDGQAGPQGSAARQQMNMAGQKIDEIINAPGFQGEIGEQIKGVAKAQKQAQNGALLEINKLEYRNEIVKKILGPDFMAIDSLKQHMEQNRQRIQVLQELANKVQNQADQTMLQEAIQAIVNQNTALQEQIQTEESTVSIFGWLMKFLSK